MRRDPAIPLFLWIAAAIVFHLATGTGVERASVVVEERADLRRFLSEVRSQVRGRPAPVELELDDVPPLPELAAAPTPPPPATAPPPPPEAKPADPERHEEDGPDEEPTKPRRKAETRPDPAAPKPPPVAEAKAPPPPKPAPATPAPPATALPAPPPDARVAIRQHVQDPNQPDNPDARQIADQANKVAEETRARVTSNTENDPVPTPGGNHQGSEAQPGNAEEHRVADREDRAGEQDRAPRPNAAEDRPAEQRRAEAASRRAGAMEEQGARGRADGATGATDPRSAAAQTGQKGQRATTAEEAAPAVIAGAEGAPAPDAREARAERKAKKARKRRLPPPRGNPGALGMLGLGAAGTTAGGLNLNLTHGHALAAVGQDQLARERRADSERRKSRHRGSWKGAGLEKWRAAIENYVAAVKPGNQTALNAARVPFAGYLAQIHNRLHPVFADSFLDSLGGLPASHPLNDPELRTNLEIVLSREDGSIVKMGVTRHSGVTAYDVAALEAVARAAPFGTPPEAIVSPDGNVYLHWEFHRNPNYACSTYYARPFLLKGKPKSAPPAAPPPVVEPPVEQRGEAPRAPAPARRTQRAAAPGQRTASR